MRFIRNVNSTSCVLTVSWRETRSYYIASIQLLFGTAWGVLCVVCVVAATDPIWYPDKSYVFRHCVSLVFLLGTVQQ